MSTAEDTDIFCSTYSSVLDGNWSGEIFGKVGWVLCQGKYNCSSGSMVVLNLSATFSQLSLLHFVSHFMKGLEVKKSAGELKLCSQPLKADISKVAQDSSE